MRNPFVYVHTACVVLGGLFLIYVIHKLTASLEAITIVLK